MTKQAKYTKLYEVLGFEEDALLSAQSLTHSMIKKQYRKMAMQWHPDKDENSPESVEMMVKLTHAWSILGDQEKRAKYDASGIGEEGLTATSLNLVGMELLQELMDALMWQKDKGNPLAALFGMDSSRPTLRDWSEKDLIKAARDALIKMRDEVKGNLATFQADLDKLQAFAQRIKWDPKKSVDGGKPGKERVGHQQGRTFNPLYGMVASHIMRLEQGLTAGNRKLLEIEACEDMLQYYTFDFTPPAPASAPEGRFHTGGLVGKKAKFWISDDFVALEDPKGKHTVGFGADVSNNPDLWPTWMQAEYANHTRASVTKPKTPREFYMEMVNKMAEDIGFGEAEGPPPSRYDYRARPEDFGPSHRKRGKDGKGRF